MATPSFRWCGIGRFMSSGRRGCSYMLLWRFLLGYAFAGIPHCLRAIVRSPWLHGYSWVATFCLTPSGAPHSPALHCYTPGPRLGLSLVACQSAWWCERACHAAHGVSRLLTCGSLPASATARSRAVSWACSLALSSASVVVPKGPARGARRAVFFVCGSRRRHSVELARSA